MITPNRDAVEAAARAYAMAFSAHGVMTWRLDSPLMVRMEAALAAALPHLALVSSQSEELDAWKQIAADNANLAVLWSSRADEHVAQRDAARGLLEECARFIGKRSIRSSDLCTRIEALLEKKP